MCLIIQGNPKNISKEIIRKAFKENPHGFGLMYLSKDTNRVITKKFFNILKKDKNVCFKIIWKCFNNFFTCFRLWFRFPTCEPLFYHLSASFL